MGEIIWIEILSPQGEVTARHRCVGRGIRIGRAYTNDVILDDPAVAPEHLHVVRDEDGTLVAEDLGSANGLFAGRDKRRVARVVLDGERIIRIGQIFLRIRTADHAVAADRVVKPPVRRWPVLLALAAAVPGLELVLLWLGETGEAEPSRYLVPVLLTAGAVLGWAALWTVLTRVFGRAGRFERNLILALAGALGATVYFELATVAAFAFSWPLLSAFQYAGLWCILGAVCVLQLHALGRPRLGLKSGVAASLVVIAITAQGVIQFGWHAGYDQRDHVRRLMPASLRIVPLKSEDAFFAEIAGMKRKIDTARSEDAP